MKQGAMPEIDGVILVAPAIWARETMPWYQSGLLTLLAHTMPGLALTGESVGVQASDNIEMLRALGRDPLVIKKTRVEAIYGLTDLMDAAFYSAEQLRGKTLLLYGEKDEVIPKKPTYEFLQRFLAKGDAPPHQDRRFLRIGLPHAVTGSAGRNTLARHPCLDK